LSLSSSLLPPLLSVLSPLLPLLLSPRRLLRWLLRRLLR
jgi:hypothetical protein